MRDAGMVTIYRLENDAPAGLMPRERLVAVASGYYENRVIGYGRYYAARGVNAQIDLLIRTNRMQATPGMYAVLSYSEDDGQYRITQVQQMTDDDGLKCTDLSLERVDELYDIEPENETDP